MPLIKDRNLYGLSPPGVFVGRIGYPYVYAGPLVPPIREDTSLFDIPELWFGKTLDEIVGFRSILIRGKHRVHVKKFMEDDKLVDRILELALSKNPVDVEILFKNKPRRTILLDDEVQPFGPSAIIKNMRVGSSSWDQKIEKAYFDTDLKASEAVVSLYKHGVLVSKIQRAFSVGAFGLKNQRRLVPTRWSITAVDSIISQNLIEQIKNFPELNEYILYESKYLDNRFEILMMPGKWRYEALEAWHPGTVWNLSGVNVVIHSDWEGYRGRAAYARIGGSYYAARLAVCERLVEDRRQAEVVVLREIYPEYIMPVGVWQVRENVRNAVKSSPIKFNTLGEALKRVSTKLQIPLQKWIKHSKLLKDAVYQRRMADFLKDKKI